MTPAFKLQDTTLAEKPEGSIQASQQVKIPQEVRRILNRGGLYELGEAFIRGEWSHNDLSALMYEIVSQRGPNSIAFRKVSPRFILSFLMDRLRNGQQGARAYEVARRHYDLGNDLFKAMLDRNTMTYTCGYWNSAQTLEEAQEAKIDLLCRKLALAPGMRVLDIGCGWGNFAHYAATRYGVSVVGLTVSKEQASLARERCKGLPVEIVVEDYRNFSGKFDRIVSIEMIEAVGRKNMHAFFRMVHDCLAPTGLFGLQVISAQLFSRNSSAALDQYILWLQKRIFPNGYLPNLAHLCAPNQEGLIIEDIHNFSVDYARTLRSWSERFQRAWPALEANYGEPFRRMWLYYLHGCEAMFRTRLVQLYQIVYSKGGLPGGYHSVRDSRAV